MSTKSNLISADELKMLKDTSSLEKIAKQYSSKARAGEEIAVSYTHLTLPTSDLV